MSYHVLSDINVTMRTLPYTESFFTWFYDGFGWLYITTALLIVAAYNYIFSPCNTIRVSKLPAIVS